ncbi:hypothetical protein BC830DRAFT_919651 [Chytriomyces sp. MP71]|nr:hypothetical protein BC830DRAFT_919651 [Chytriomyces sp. MP71]
MLGTGQQENYKYFWFCDTDTKERKMIMNVSSYSAFDDSRLIVWASKVIYEKDLAVPENYVQANCVPLKPTSKDPTATHVPSSTTSTIPPTSGTTSTNAFHSASPTTLTPTSTTVSLPPRLPQKVLPNRCVCSYCKRIMVLTDDIPPHITRAILAASASLPAAIVYDGPLPVLGARGRAGVQPALPKNASLEDGTEGMHAVGGVTPSLMEAVKAGGGPVQLSVQGVVNHLWLSPHLYYNVARLDDAIEIHNGVCEVCYAEIGWLFFKRGTFVNGVRVLAEECLGAEKRRLEVAERAVEVEKRELVNAAGSGLKRKDTGVGEKGVLPVKRVGGEDLSGEKKRVRSIVPRPAHVPANVM